MGGEGYLARRLRAVVVLIALTLVFTTTVTSLTVAHLFSLNTSDVSADPLDAEVYLAAIAGFSEFGVGFEDFNMNYNESSGVDLGRQAVTSGHDTILVLSYNADLVDRLHSSVSTAYNVPLVGALVEDDSLSSQLDHPWFTRTSMPASHRAAALITVAIHFGATQAHVIYDESDPLSQATYDIVVGAAARAALTLKPSNLPASEPRTFAAALEAASDMSVHINLMPGAAFAEVFELAAETGVMGCGYQWLVPVVSDLDGLEWTRALGFDLAESGSAEYEAFVAKYQEVRVLQSTPEFFPAIPSLVGAQVYDAVNAIAHAEERLGPNPTGIEILFALRSNEFQGASRYLYYGNSNNPALSSNLQLTNGNETLAVYSVDANGVATVTVSATSPPDWAGASLCEEPEPEPPAEPEPQGALWTLFLILMIVYAVAVAFGIFQLYRMDASSKDE